jgi:hypothetical protein
MGESHANWIAAVPSLVQRGRPSNNINATTAKLPRETYPNSGIESHDQVIMNSLTGLEEQVQAQGDEMNEILTSAAPSTATAPISLGKKRPALAHLPAPDPIRQHLDTVTDTSFEDLNSSSAHRARLIAILSYIHQYSNEMELRINARVSNLENSRNIVQKNEIAVITINPTMADLNEHQKEVPNCKEKTPKRSKTTNKIDKNNNQGDDDTVDALHSLREMQYSQLEIRYATMETHFKTHLAFALAQKEESQRSAASLQSIANAAMEQAKQCRDEVAAVKAQMRTAHVALLQKVATIVQNLKHEVDSLKDDNDALAAQAIIASRQAPPEVSSTSGDERHQSAE